MERESNYDNDGLDPSEEYFTKKKDNLLVGKGIFRLFVRISLIFFS